MPPVPRPHLPPEVAPRAPTFDELYRRHVHDVARWAHRLGGPTVDGEEVVQEVFLTASRRLTEFRGDAKVTTWLFRITRGVVANMRRAARRRGFWAQLSNRVFATTAGHVPAPGDEIEARQASDRFQRVLDDLPERYRSVLVLFELEEMSTDDIARFLDHPPATIRVWLHRARARFTERWQAARRREEEETP
jgi:RNA polymerase sigma-70 factor (ECF subfamily)